MTRNDIKSILFGLILPVCFSFVLGLFILGNVDRKVWNQVDEHIDEFVYDHSTEGVFHIFELRDKDGEYVCEIFLNSRRKTASVFDDYALIASSANIFKNRKTYNYLIKKIPDECIVKDIPKKELLKKF